MLPAAAGLLGVLGLLPATLGFAAATFGFAAATAGLAPGVGFFAAGLGLPARAGLLLLTGGLDLPFADAVEPAVDERARPAVKGDFPGGEGLSPWGAGAKADVGVCVCLHNVRGSWAWADFLFHTFAACGAAGTRELHAGRGEKTCACMSDGPSGTV